MKLRPRIALLLLLCAVSASAATVTIFDKRQFSIPVPDGWKYEEPVSRESSLRNVLIADPAGTVKLAFTFVPDPEKQFATKEQLSAMMGEALAELLAGAVEKQLSFTVVDVPGGYEAHSLFTDKKLVGVKTLPKDEWRYITAGVRTFRGGFIFFSLASNEVESAARTKALSIVTNELREVR